MKFAACITTMNRPKELNACLKALWESSQKPHCIVVSDNSENKETQGQNREIVERYPGSIYVEGTHSGVSSNRNNALSHVPDNVEIVTFLADDICVDSSFIELGIERYKKLSAPTRKYTILSGNNLDELDSPNDDCPLSVDFRGFFCKWEEGLPRVVCLYSSMFPKHFLDLEKWDENIFMGQEDIELSLRALKRGYQILHCPEMKVFDTCAGRPGVSSSDQGSLESYQIYVFGSRLYIGFKRYKLISPNPFKLLIFLVTYFNSTSRYLIKRGSLQLWPEIIRTSNIIKLYRDT